MMIPKTLDEAYTLYQSGKSFGRGDLFRFVIDEIKVLQARIGSVDEAAVSAIADRVGALEITIGNALRSAPAGNGVAKRGPGRPRRAVPSATPHPEQEAANV